MTQEINRRKPNGYDKRVERQFIGFMDDLILAPDTVIKKDHMKTAICIIKKQRLLIYNLNSRLKLVKAQYILSGWRPHDTGNQ